MNRAGDGGYWLLKKLVQMQDEKTRLQVQLEALQGTNQEKPKRAIRPHNFQVIRGGRGEVGDE